MSPTTTVSKNATNVANFSPQKNIKERFAEKRLIVCYDKDPKSIQDTLLTYKYLLESYPQWSSNVAIVFFTSPFDTSFTENVYFYPNPDKETYNVITTSASVNIALQSTADTNAIAQKVPTLTNEKTELSIQNEISLVSMDTEEVVATLDKALHTRPLNEKILLDAYKCADQRLFLFDYDGTLTPIVSKPADAQPTPTLLKNLTELCEDPKNTVWVISGRDKNFLDTYLGKIPRLGLSAEHGSFMKDADDWEDMLKDADMSWKGVATDIFEKYTSANPGTVIEQKKSSITWHYRNAEDTEEAEKQSELCYKELIQIPGVDILEGKMNLEVRSLLVNKGKVVKRIQCKQQKPSDFIMCCGDDQTDEDMFSALQDNGKSFCISVGPLSKKTLAAYSIENSEDIVNILGQLISQKSNSSL